MNPQDSISTLPFVGPTYQKKLKKLNILTIYDLLHHIPHRYIDFSKFTKIKDIKTNDLVSIYGEVISIINRPTKSGKLMQLGTIDDGSGKINVVWFNQYYLIKTLFPGTKLIISGKATWFNRKLAFFNPQYEKMDYPHESVHTGKIVGVYPSTAGITNKWLKSRIKYALDRVHFSDFLDKKVLTKYNLLHFQEAIQKIHFPKKDEDYKVARDRLAFNEFFDLLMKAKQRKKRLQKKKSISFVVDNNKYEQFVKSLPFKLTDSQTKVCYEILKDLQKNTSMNRLLQGDVGSGKTVVAILSSFISYMNGYQTVLLAPTQILANQHYKTYLQMFKNLDVKIALITGSTIKEDIGKIDIFIGTHALINKVSEFDNVGLLIIDEQHKFGVKQIDFLKGFNPHKLTMTATPIPRTIAQTLFSDMDLSIINELPKNRADIKTWLVPDEKRSKAYDWIKTEMDTNKSQAFVICPLVEESESETLKDIKSVKKEFEFLSKIFSHYKLGLLHGKLKEKEKNKVLNDFKMKKIDILVSTPVVEVGIDIPNATIMVIEGADRFGLAGLHQLRGRVGRGQKQSYCLLFATQSNKLLQNETTNEKAIKRLSALTKTHSGFELAEIDFKLRGAGEILGTKQSGLGNLKIANWSDLKIIKMASEVVGTYFDKK